MGGQRRKLPFSIMFYQSARAFKASEAYIWFKETHNIRELTDVQRRKAWIEYAIRLVKENAEKLVIASQSKKTRLERLHAHLTNARSRFGQKVFQQ